MSSEKTETKVTEATKPLVGILGRKLGISQTYDDRGVLHPVTLIQAGPCVVVQRKTVERDGYSAIQLGLLPRSGKPVKGVTKPMLGHFKAASVEPVKPLKEVRLPADDARPDLVPGQRIVASDLLEGSYLDAVGNSKGKGFQGTIKRHGFARGPMTHGSMSHRSPGSIGAAAYPARVFKGTRMAGQMGGKRVTVKNLKVMRVDADQDLVFLRGSVPGARNSIVLLCPAKRGGKGA